MDLPKDQKEKLNRQVSQLQDTINGKDLELRLLEMELIDVNKPFVSIGETQGLFIEMLSEIMKHVKAKGKSDKATASQKRILRLMELNEQLSSIAESNNALKLFIREVHSHYQLLRIENYELKVELKKIADAQGF